MTQERIRQELSLAEFGDCRHSVGVLERDGDGTVVRCEACRRRFEVTVWWLAGLASFRPGSAVRP